MAAIVDSPSVPCPWHMFADGEHPDGAPECRVLPEDLSMRVIQIGALLVWLALQAGEAQAAYVQVYDVVQQAIGGLHVAEGAPLLDSDDTSTSASAGLDEVEPVPSGVPDDPSPSDDREAG